MLVAPCEGNPPVTGDAPCEGNSLVTAEFPFQRARNAETVSIWLRHHEWLELRTHTYGFSPGKGHMKTRGINHWSNYKWYLGVSLIVPHFHIIHISPVGVCFFFSQWIFDIYIWHIYIWHIYIYIYLYICHIYTFWNTPTVSWIYIYIYILYIYISMTPWVCFRMSKPLPPLTLNFRDSQCAPVGSAIDPGTL